MQKEKLKSEALKPSENWLLGRKFVRDQKIVKRLSL